MSLALEAYCKKWRLSSPTLLASTFTSEVFLVQYYGTSAVLKIMNPKGKASESIGAIALTCFNGNGSVRLLRADSDAHLLEAVDGIPLKNLTAAGDDLKATEIISEAVQKLHSYQGPHPRELFSMGRNFQSLFEKAKTEPAGSIYSEGANLASHLLQNEQEVRLLHGDIHHENILFSSQRGWLAIDPKGLIGERTYEVANVFYNPSGFENLVKTPDVILNRAQIFSKELRLDQKRILEYAFTYGCLSAVWCLENEQDPGSTLRIAESIRRLL